MLEPEAGNRFGTKWAYADQIDPVDRGECKKCPVCGSPVSGLEWLPPHLIKLSSAKPEKWGDFVWGAGFKLIVSQFFRQTYKKEGLVGLAFYPPAEIVRLGRGKTGVLPANLPTYYLAIFLGERPIWMTLNPEQSARTKFANIAEGQY